MKPEAVLKAMSLLSPIEHDIISLVAKGKKPGTIARKTGLRKKAVERHIVIINKVLREVACNV